jgi:bifunctional ADP-heptose synthase (sugar kinase/adenylyltransferase)
MKVLLIGESCFDIFFYGKCERLCPEAPVPVFQPVLPEKTNMGMAANVLTNLLSLERQYQNGIKYEFWTNETTNKKIRYVDLESNQMLLRVDEEGDYKNNTFDLSSVKDFDAVIVSDYNKGLLSDADLFQIAKNAKLSFIDTKKKYNSLWAEHFDYIKINKKEAHENGFHNKDSLNYNLIITAGSEGCYYQNKQIPIKERAEVRDVCGAGDTFLAGLSYRILMGDDVRKAIDFAQKICQNVISKRGVVSI